MRVVVAGVEGPVGQGVAARLVSLGHDVIGVGPRRPESWPGSVVFITADVTDDATLTHVFMGAVAVVHCGPEDEGTSVLVDTAAAAGVGHVVVASRLPSERAGLTVIRTPMMLGRNVDDDCLRRFVGPFVPDDGSADAPLQVVHPEDVQRAFVHALTASEPGPATVDVAADGHTTIRAIANAVGRPVIRVPWRRGRAAPPQLDASGVSSWSASECVADFTLACRGRMTFGDKVFALPWRLPRVRRIPAVDAPAPDGVAPVPAGIDNANGEFDTPIDPRFPAFVATNLSEALAGPFTPSSASVSVLGTRASGMVIAARLRPGGAVQREMSVRTTGVFGHRLYAGLTSGHFMAQTVPLVDPELILAAFFGRTVEGLELFGDRRPPVEPRGFGKQLRAVATFANNLLVLSAGSFRDTRDFVADVARLEQQATDAAVLDDRRLQTLVLLARDHVVHGWVLASASILVSHAYGVILRLLAGREVMPTTGPDLASAQSLEAVHRLVELAGTEPAAAELLAQPAIDLATLAERAPRFVAALHRELALVGHRGPGEVEMRSTTYADDPTQLMRMVAKALVAGPREAPPPPRIPGPLTPIAAAAASQLREREVRRDRMVRAIWVLRTLLREHGRRLVAAGRLAEADDVFYLLVDELDAPPPDMAAVVARRRAQQQALELLVPPEAFSGTWRPTPAPGAALAGGETLRGMGVGGGRARGLVRVVHAGTIDDLQPGEVLVAKVTDIGYTPAFAYAAAVVTELGGPISHAAIVAREFGVPCVVNARGATTRLATGTLIEVDGASGEVTVLPE
ncbi:NAD-dependent epimerase/dehydratase family protein [Mycolicibacterium sp. P9-64]|uniref:PEP-utilizing enzyme n=1 Tax=Mycolicibacterium sp. P9-64 TaxID=2024612 RepID=UPI0011ED6B10|nr:PEP-utilizing enzyme [Mycolicibacterium sp. P9-64]KAA0079672.1 NAD-dependent epimerase/dehydratase family protein [Mycolicibacterium sp. P9-64]